MRDNASLDLWWRDRKIKWSRGEEGEGRKQRKEIREFDREASGGGRFLNDCARYRTIDLQSPCNMVVAQYARQDTMAVSGYNRRRSDKEGDKFAIGKAIHRFTVFMEYSMPFPIYIIRNMAHFYSRFSFVSSCVIVERIILWMCLTIVVYTCFIRISRHLSAIDSLIDQIDLNYFLSNYCKI